MPLLYTSDQFPKLGKHFKVLLAWAYGMNNYAVVLWDTRNNDAAIVGYVPTNSPSIVNAILLPFYDNLK